MHDWKFNAPAVVWSLRVLGSAPRSALLAPGERQRVFFDRGLARAGQLTPTLVGGSGSGSGGGGGSGSGSGGGGGSADLGAAAGGDRAASHAAVLDRVPQSVAQRARNRWCLAYTLVCNPALRAFRVRPAPFRLVRGAQVEQEQQGGQ
jgi:hypothetical protein